MNVYTFSCPDRKFACVVVASDLSQARTFVDDLLTRYPLNLPPLEETETVWCMPSFAPLGRVLTVDDVWSGGGV